MPISYLTIDRADYEDTRARGLSTAVDVYGCDPGAIRSPWHCCGSYLPLHQQ